MKRQETEENRARRFLAKLKSASAVSFSQELEEQKVSPETYEEFEARTWRDKGHYDENEIAFIPAMAFKQALTAASKRRNDKVPDGGGKRNFTQLFESGILIMKNVSIGVKKSEMKPGTYSCNPGGERGGGKRVKKTFPEVLAWSGELEIYVFEDKIDETILLKTLRTAGMFIGVGRFRPERGGFFGRFEVLSLTEQE